MVSQYRQDNGDVSFFRLLNYAKAHGNKVLGRERKTHQFTFKAPATLNSWRLHSVRKIRGAAHLADSIPRSDLRSAYGNDFDESEGAFVAEGDFVEYSDCYGHEDQDLSGTSTVRTPTYTESSDPCCRSWIAGIRLPRESRWKTRERRSRDRVGW